MFFVPLKLCLREPEHDRKCGFGEDRDRNQEELWTRPKVRHVFKDKCCKTSLVGTPSLMTETKESIL